MKIIAIEDQCEDCSGRGYLIDDFCDHNGEHQQHEHTCETCDGTGLK